MSKNAGSAASSSSQPASSSSQPGLSAALLNQRGVAPVQLFTECDGDGDGLVSCADFVAGLRRLGLDVAQPEQAFRQLAGGSETLNYSDLSRSLRRQIREHPLSAAPAQPAASSSSSIDDRVRALQDQMQEARGNMA